MKGKLTRSAFLAATLGCVFQFGGCLGTGKGFVRNVLFGTVGYSTLELLLDNDAIFDLFEDGSAAGV